MEQNKIEWYSLDRILSYNGFINFVMSPRGNGKTYAAKVRGIKRFKKFGEEFIYIRRTEKQLKTISTFFDDVKLEFPNDEFKVVGRTFYMNGKKMGYALALSTSPNVRSVPYPLVTTVIFDEFVLDKRIQRYLPNEVEVFLELINTIVRKRDNVKVILLANSITKINPYFTYFKCIPKDGERFTTKQNGLVVVEFFESESYLNAISETKFGQLITGTKYGDFALKNKSLRDNDMFILKKKPKDSKFIFSVKYNGYEVGFHISYEEGYWYCNDEIDINSKRRFTITKEDHELNMIMYNSLNNFVMFKEFIRCYREGYARFKNHEIKSRTYDMMSYLGIR